MKTTPNGELSTDRPAWQAVLKLASSCDYEAGHARDVTALALRLFDGLQSLHGLGGEARFWLRCAGELHDIGWVEGPKAHHKTSLRLIRTSPLLAFSARERLIIGSVARYHRKALPDLSHEHYAALTPSDREIVRLLAGLLRVADGLDRTHAGLIKSLTCEIRLENIMVRCSAAHPAEEERRAALDKAELFKQAFGRELVIEWLIV